MSSPVVTRGTVATAITALLASGSVAEAGEFPFLSRHCESALALSAAPANISMSAAVYVLTEDGYELVRDGENDFSCIVARNHPESLLPICYDKEGSETIMQTVIGTADLIVSGATDVELDEAISGGFESGEYSRPESTSLSYMLSAFNYGYREESGRMVNMRPHSMISTEHTRDSIDFDAEMHAYHDVLPTISPMGPYRFFIIRAENPADSSDVMAHCEGQLGFLPQ